VRPGKAIIIKVYLHFAFKISLQAIRNLLPDQKNLFKPKTDMENLYLKERF